MCNTQRSAPVAKTTPAASGGATPPTAATKRKQITGGGGGGEQKGKQKRAKIDVPVGESSSAEGPDTDTAGPDVAAAEIAVSVRGPTGLKRVNVVSNASLRELQSAINAIFTATVANIDSNDLVLSGRSPVTGQEYSTANNAAQIHTLGIVQGARLQVNYQMPAAAAVPKQTNVPSSKIMLETHTHTHLLS